MKMKNTYNEKQKLPLTFEYMEVFRKKNKRRKYVQNAIYFIECNKYQTNYYLREKPVKALVRML